MKIKVILILFLLLSASSVKAEDFDYEYLQAIQVSSANGFVWEKKTVAEKSLYLMGYEDGYLNALAYELSDQKAREEAMFKLPSFYDQNNIKRDDLIEKLDEFYGQHDAYKVFPISLALRFVIFKDLGMESAIDKEQAKFFEDMINKVIDESK